MNQPAFLFLELNFCTITAWLMTHLMKNRNVCRRTRGIILCTSHNSYLNRFTNKSKQKWWNYFPRKYDKTCLYLVRIIGYGGQVRRKTMKERYYTSAMEWPEYLPYSQQENNFNNNEIKTWWIVRKKQNQKPDKTPGSSGANSPSAFSKNGHGPVFEYSVLTGDVSAAATCCW